MANQWFQFKQFTVHQDLCAMKVTTDACLFGAWTARNLSALHLNKILDIGTGTGLLSLMIAQQCNATIDAIEIDKAAAKQARENMDASPWKERLNVIQGDVKEIMTPSIVQYNVIVSNPPFYENELQSGNKQKNTAHHSTELLLDDLISLINSDEFYLLLPYKRYKEIDILFNQTDLTITQKVVVRQSVNHDFFRIMLRGQKGKNTASCVETEISIKDVRDNYTPEFIDLLKDYYLYL